MKSFMSLSLCFILSLLINVSSVSAKEVTGEGYGKSKEEASKSALADLSSAIQVEVKSDFESISGQIGKEEFSNVQSIVSVKSSLPILGATFDSFPLKPEILVRAILTSGKALLLYEEKLKQLNREISSNIKLLKETKSGSSRYRILTGLLSQLDQYYKHKIVAVFLGGKDIPEIQITEAEIRKELNSVETSVDSVDLAAKLIAKGIDKKRIFISPPAAKHSHEITQFAGIVKDRLSVYLKTAGTPKGADYFMTGSYEILKDGIELTYRLSDNNSGTLKTAVVKLRPESYAAYETKPQTVSFDKLLHEGIIVSNDFRIEISTSKGKDSLLYKKEEELELFIKSNRSGYFYIVGHIAKPKEKYSYLTEIQDAEGKRKFVYFINADDVNKWISLGKFEIVQPYGVESLQLIASNKDLIDKLPPARYDRKTELYVISDNPESGVMKTRAIRPKKSSKNKVLSAEAVLMFTTMGK